MSRCRSLGAPSPTPCVICAVNRGHLRTRWHGRPGSCYSVTAGGLPGGRAKGPFLHLFSPSSLVQPFLLLLPDTLGLPHKDKSVLGPEVPALTGGGTHWDKSHWGKENSSCDLRRGLMCGLAKGPCWLSLWELGAVPHLLGETWKQSQGIRAGAGQGGSS